MTANRQRLLNWLAAISLFVSMATLLLLVISCFYSFGYGSIDSGNLWSVYGFDQGSFVHRTFVLQGPVGFWGGLNTHAPRYDGTTEWGSSALYPAIFALRFPLWWFAAAFLTLPIFRFNDLLDRSLLRPNQRQRWHRNGLCPSCGYDIRATPDRCPECGQNVPSADAMRYEITWLGRAFLFLLWQLKHPRRLITPLTCTLIATLAVTVTALGYAENFSRFFVPYSNVRFWDRLCVGLVVLASTCTATLVVSIFGLMAQNWRILFNPQPESPLPIPPESATAS